MAFGAVASRHGRPGLDGVSIAVANKGPSGPCVLVSFGGSALAAVGGCERKVDLLVGSGRDRGKARVVAVESGGRSLFRAGPRPKARMISIRTSVLGLGPETHAAERPSWRLLPEGGVEFDLPEWAMAPEAS